MNRRSTAGAWGRRSLIAAAAGLFAAAAPLSSATAASAAPAYDPTPFGGTAPATHAWPAGTPRSVAPQPPTRPLPLSASGKAAVSNRTVGLLSYVKPDGQPASCSAAVVVSQHHNLLVTAGHCLMPGGSGTYNTHFIFKPGWRFGEPSAPYGEWKGERAWVNKGWGEKGNINYDYGFVTLKPNGHGKEVQDVVGANGLEVNQPYVGERTAFGYVRAHQEKCVGETRLRYPAWISEQLRLDCTNFIHGSSGGPWINGYSPARELGTINGVISTWPSETDHSFILSPYFDDDTWDLYMYGRNHV